MTLIIAAKTKEGVVLGCDSRAVTGDNNGTRFISDSSEKLVQLNKHCCVLMAGDSQVGVYLIEKFKKQVKTKEDIISISKKLSNFCRKEFKPYLEFVPPRSNNFPVVGFILAGFEKEKNKYTNPKIFVLKSWNSFFTGEEKEYSIEGKGTIANYLFAKKYDQCSLSIEEMQKLIVQSLYDTEKIDGEAGGKMHVGAITKKYGYVEGTVKDYIEKIENQDIIRLIDC